MAAGERSGFFPGGKITRHHIVYPYLKIKAVNFIVEINYNPLSQSRCIFHDIMLYFHIVDNELRDVSCKATL